MHPDRPDRPWNPALLGVPTPPLCLPSGKMPVKQWPLVTRSPALTTVNLGEASHVAASWVLREHPGLGTSHAPGQPAPSGCLESVARFPGCGGSRSCSRLSGVDVKGFGSCPLTPGCGSRKGHERSEGQGKGQPALPPKPPFNQG